MTTREEAEREVERRRKPMTKQERLVDALRWLVRQMYNDLQGAYGATDGTCYQGQYEEEIQELAAAICAAGELEGE